VYVAANGIAPGMATPARGACARAVGLGSAAESASTASRQQGLTVLRDRPLRDVVDLEPDAAIEIEVASIRYPGRTHDPRLHFQPCRVPEVVRVQVIRQGSRTHHAHVAPKDAEDQRQILELHSLDDAPNVCGVRVVAALHISDADAVPLLGPPCRLTLAPAQPPRGAHLVRAESTTAASHVVLGREHRPRGFETHRNGTDGQQRQHDGKNQQTDEQIECTLCALVLDVPTREPLGVQLAMREDAWRDQRALRSGYVRA
jgi:hypothetical protein